MGNSKGSKKNIVLTGFMGVGKDTVGKVVAQTLGFKFIATDELITQREKKSLSEIINTKGEEYLHSVEQEILEELSKDKKGRMVISTGGEIVAHEPSCELIKKLGLVVYLHTSPNEIFNRMIKTPNKRHQFKDLKGAELEKEVNHLMEIRENLYECIKDVAVDTQGKSPLETAEDIVDTWLSLN